MALLPLAALFFIRLAGGFQFQSMAVAAPLLVAHGFSYAQAGALLGAFVLPGIVVTVPAGLLAQRFGDRRVLVGGLLLMALGGALAAVAPGFATVFAARVVSGIGGVSVVMLAIKMTADRSTKATALAMVITAWPTGMAVGLLALGPLPAVAGWRGTLALASLAPLAVLPLVPFAGASRRRGAPAAAPRGASPGVGFVALAAATWGLWNGSLGVLAGFLQPYLMAVGQSPQRAAATASIAVWSSAAIPLGGILADLCIGRTAAVVAGTILSAGLLCLTPAVGGAIPVLLALGVAFALAPAPLAAQVGQATPAGARAIVFGWFSGAAFLGITVAPWLAGAIRDATGLAAAPLWFAAALMMAMLPSYAGFLRMVSRPPP